MTSAQFSNARILVVDDDESIRRLFEATLTMYGYHNVHLVSDARDVSRLVAARAPDLIILDLHMPHVDGFAVLEQLRPLLDASSYLPILVVTADITAETRQRALAGGAHDYIEKPFDVTELQLRIANLLQTRFLHVELERHNRALERRLRAEIEHRRAQQQHREQRIEAVRQILDTEAITTVLQPIVAIDSGAIVGHEALTRFPSEPVRPPDFWFQESRDVGLGEDLELLALRAATRRLAELPDHHYLSLNVSPQTARSDAWLAVLAEVASDRLVIELTEHEAVRDYHVLIERFAELRARGVRIAVDDTGAGYAGLNHLLGLQPDIIKLDRQLVSGIHDHPTKRALAAALVMFAGEIGASVTAEGIETTAEARVLRDLGVRCGQGYLYAHPAAEPVLIDLRESVVRA